MKKEINRHLFFTGLFLLCAVVGCETPVNETPVNETPPPIKWLDISSEIDRHTMIAEGTPALYNGHPTTVMLDDNKTMFCVWSKDHGGVPAFLAKSEDAGLTWTQLPVPTDWATTKNCPSIYRLTDKQGKQRLMVFTAKPEMSQTYSEDNGVTWSPVVSLKKSCIMAFTSIIQLKNGNYLGLYSRGRNNEDDVSTNPQFVLGSISEDGGLTWSNSFLVSMSDKSPCEPCLIRSPDGNQLMVLMRDNSRTGESLIMYSNDESTTWTAIKETIPYLTGDRHVAKYTSDGRLVVAFRDMMVGSPFYGHFVAWVGRYEDIVNRKEGQYRIKLLNSYAGWDCGYPGLEILPDGTIIATTYIKYTEGNNKQSIVSTRFKLVDLEQKEAVEILE
jgi:photosystem II stability/assembly factor-like uncharacterized protein